MKILFVIRDMFTGGAGKQLALTASSLVERGHEVFLYTYIGSTMEHKIDQRIQYIPELAPPHNKLTEYLCTPRNIRQIVKSIAPDIVISWRANSGCMTVLACMGLGVKVVYSERSDPYMETSLLLKIATRICGYSDGGVFQTVQAQAYYKRLIKKSIVLPNPVILDNIPADYKPLTDRNNSIVWIGRLQEPQKRLDVLLKSFNYVLGVFPDMTLSIYGDGPHKDDTMALTKQLGLTGSVFFQGKTSNAIDTIKDYRLLILSSDYEGIPNVIIEAFIAGVPVVTTDCSPGGARVLIEDGINGFIVPIGDFEMLGRKACELIGNNTLSEMFVRKSKEHLKRFDSKDIFDQWNTYLMNLAKQ